MNAGLQYEIFPAINGKALTKQEIAQHTQALIYGFWPGETGCALSHIAIYRKRLDENIAQAFILEDDALLTAGLPEMRSSPTYDTAFAVLSFKQIVDMKASPTPQE
ncbi:glycosyltransferase family 25 protein [Pantoea sp. C2G6]|uniref:glycosyltransferase family 25 protein n=1 Tax=Pantoea sp. C2G6 TaxID=3243084 RepID=UPI003EDA5F6D